MTSLLAAAVAFSLLGFLAHHLHEADVRSMCRGQVAPHLLWDQVCCSGMSLIVLVQILRSLAYLPSHEAEIFSFLYQLMLALGLPY